MTGFGQEIYAGQDGSSYSSDALSEDRASLCCASSGFRYFRCHSERREESVSQTAGAQILRCAQDDMLGLGK